MTAAPVLTSDLSTPYARSVAIEAATLRGVIITKYTEVEVLLIDLVMRCQQRPEYADVYPGFPYKLEERIKAVRQIMNYPGSLHTYQEEIEAVVDGLLQYDTYRHFMAHGQLIIKTDGSTLHTLTYRFYRRAKAGAELGQMDATLHQLRNVALALGEYANRFIAIFARMYREQRMEPV